MSYQLSTKSASFLLALKSSILLINCGTNGNLFAIPVVLLKGGFVLLILP